MSKIVLDASAFLALLQQEPGAEVVEKHLSNAIMSAVNVAETLTILQDTSIEKQNAENLVTEIIQEIIPFDLAQACHVADLKKLTKPFGLSFGDRACLALAKINHLPILTADKIWGKLDAGIKIHLIR